MPMLVERAPAKLNLYLHVQGRRADGYHALESLVAFADLADVLRVEPAAQLTLTLDGAFADHAGATEQNLVLKAARALQAATDTRHGAALTLTKNIPVGAGLGGGSADAAAALRLLNRFWNLNLPHARLHAIALTLGADVPMCLDSRPAIARGIGEDLTPLPDALPVLYAVLIHPRTPLLTAEVFGALHVSALPKTAAVMAENQDFWAFLATTRNDLQRAAISVRAEVAEVLLALEAALPPPQLVRMTGSGACCFGLYSEPSAAEKSAHALRQQHPKWWVEVTMIG